MNKEKALERLDSLEREAKELRKIINEVEKISPEKYLEQILSECVGRVTYGGITWYLNDEWVFREDYKRNTLWCYYYKVWEVFETKYNMEYGQIQELQRNVVGKALNCKELIPLFANSSSLIKMGKALNCKELLPKNTG